MGRSLTSVERNTTESLESEFRILVLYEGEDIASHVVSSQNVWLLEVLEVLLAISVHENATERKDTVNEQHRGHDVRDPVGERIHDDQEGDHHKDPDEE